MGLDAVGSDAMRESHDGVRLSLVATISMASFIVLGTIDRAL